MRVLKIFGFLIGAVSVSLIAKAADSSDLGSSEEPSARERGDYVLQPLDLLQIRFFQESDMDREVRISREDTVTLPLVGSVVLRGLTLSEAESELRVLYDRNYLVNPQVNVVVLEYSRRTVNVLGSVTAPGQIAFPQEEGLTLLDAISRAGGFTRLAERRKITLTRKLDSGKIETFTIDANDFIEGDSEERWVLETDDLIYVPERFL